MAPWTKRLYWQLCVLALGAGLLGTEGALAAALGIALLQLVHSAWARGGALAMETQVRAAFAALLTAGLAWPAGLGWLHGAMLLGTGALLVADYCLLARLLTLLPWNRSTRLSPGLAWRILRLPPGPGTVAARLGIAPAGKTRPDSDLVRTTGPTGGG